MSEIGGRAGTLISFEPAPKRDILLLCMKTQDEIDEEKQSAARAVLGWVRPGMRLGLGSGSTSEWFARLLARALASGGLSDVVAVPTSERVAALAGNLGIPLMELGEDTVLDLAVDGADEIGPGLQLIKGGGGALLREKVVAMAARRSVIFADSTKVVSRLGKFPLPLEVAAFAMGFVQREIKAIGGRCKRRERNGEPVLTDQKLMLLDCHFGPMDEPGIENPRVLQNHLAHIPGVAAHGLFLDTTSAAVVADGASIRVITLAGERLLPEVILEELPAPTPQGIGGKP